MRSNVARWILFVTLCLAAAAARANDRFTFACPAKRFGTGNPGDEGTYSSMVKSNLAYNTKVHVHMDQHLPNSKWFAQWCHTDSGRCYISDQDVWLTPNLADSLQADIFSDYSNKGIGFVDLTVKSVADSFDVDHCCYTMFSGVPIPTDVSYTISDADNFRGVHGGQEVELDSPFRNNSGIRDTMLVYPTSGGPSGWFTQYCQASTGICYYGPAQVPMAPGISDTLKIDFYIFDIPGSGWLQLEVHSKRNPSLAQWLRYEVINGDYSAGVPVAQGGANLRVVAQPNPFTSDVTLQLQSPVSSQGSLQIFAADGRLVRSFPSIAIASGLTRVYWDGRSAGGGAAPSGVYFFRLHAGEQLSRGMIIRSR